MLSLAAVPSPVGALISGAQDSDTGQAETNDSTEADEEEFDGRSTEDTVRFVVGTLVGIAAVTTVMMLVFIWHTSPRRRLRVATRRADRERERSLAEVDDEGAGVTLDELLGEREETETADWADAENAGVELGELAAEVTGSGEAETNEPARAESAEVGESRD